MSVATTTQTGRWWATERPRPAWLREWPSAWKLTVATVCFGAFMGQLDASVVTLTYRPVERAFGVGLAGVEWVSLAYLLVLVALLLPLARLSDMRGRKLAYTYGFVVFTLGSAAAGLAPSLPVLLVSRGLQATGAALLQANSVAIVVTAAPVGRIRHALGVQAAAQAVGLAIGPTVGGLIVSTVGWRWVYAVNVPIGLVAVAVATWVLPRTRDRATPRSVDRPSLGLLAGATTAVLVAGSALSGLSIPAWATAALVVVGATVSVAFVRRQRRAANPLLPPQLFHVSSFKAGLGGALCGYLALFGPLVVVPSVLGGSSLRAGLVLTALPAGFALAATTSNWWLPRAWGDGTRAVAGALVAVAGLALAAVSPLHPSVLLPALALAGVGLGAFTPANNAAVMRSVPAKRSATGGGLLNMARGLGTALGVSLVAICLHLAGTPATGGRVAFATLAAAALGAAVCSARPSRRLTA